MPKRLELNITPEQAANDEFIKNIVKGSIDFELGFIQKIKQSIDARRKPVMIRLVVDVYSLDEEYETEIWEVDFPNATSKKSAVIIGFGPAGMFAALRLLERGIKPVIIERGKPVKDRRRDLAVLNREGIVNPESNYCFGEGGAGTYSDGKLYTRSKKRGDVRKVLEIFVAHGADENILYLAHPHIGTNKLPQIVEAIRQTIIDKGGEVLFNEKLTDIMVNDGAVKAIHLASGKEIETNEIILATGHSARDIFELLHKKQIAIEAKSFALGVRIEHPQTLIDSIQYSCETRSEFFPPAAYSLVEQANGRGVFSFCMCPGGIIAPAATSPGEIVVNGWSPSRRNGRFANSGMVVSVNPPDWEKFKEFGPLAAMKYQEEIEQKAYNSVGKNLVAPAQRLIDFIDKKNSSTLPECSYIPGVQAASMDDIIPIEISKSLRLGLQQMGRKMKGYLSPEGIVIGVESRTSSPVKIPRDKETLQHPDIKGLFPCGEGAGYAGGIVSAALDGMACAERIL
ncbi:MAG: NAD(P)/FAD-dependent oxidoreductase [Bacteroidia bacterium]